MNGDDSAAERCRLRWVVDIEAETATGCFQERLALLPAAEQAHVISFLQPADQQRALASRLLQRCCVGVALGVAWEEVALAATQGRKPFTTNAKPGHAPNFNFNVSHEGRYVALASDPLYLVGVDVAAPRRCRPGGTAVTAAAAAPRPLEQYLQSFRGQFATSEWELLQRLASEEDRREAAFQRLWSLKEAFVKARGDGLGFQPLSRAAFNLPGDDPWAASAQLVLDGVAQPSWRFSLEPLPYGHCVSVALGPPAAAVDQFGVFRGTLRALHVAPGPSTTAREFQLVSLSGLLSKARD